MRVQKGELGGLSEGRWVSPGLLGELECCSQLLLRLCGWFESQIHLLRNRE